MLMIKTSLITFLHLSPLLSPRGWLLGAVLLCLSLSSQARTELIGRWQINEDLSDNTDKQVEVALKADGQKIERRLFDRRKDRYRGGPEEHELYDRISYDQVLEISPQGEHYRFTYEDDFVRNIYTDNRSRTVSLSAIEEVADFSLGHWEDERFLVEGRVRDGGFTQETYRINSAGQLRATFYIKPKSFGHPIELTRIYDRVTSP